MILFTIKIIVTYFARKKRMNSYDFIYKSISIYFHLRKVVNMNYLKKIFMTLFIKKKETVIALFKNNIKI